MVDGGDQNGMWRRGDPMGGGGTTGDDQWQLGDVVRRPDVEGKRGGGARGREQRSKGSTIFRMLKGTHWSWWWRWGWSVAGRRCAP